MAASRVKCTCGAQVKRFWSFCPSCGKKYVWKDERGVTGCECYYCRWIVSDSFSFCPWCGRDIEEESSSEEPLKSPRGFTPDARCDRGCGGYVQYPMRFCPWCGKRQGWGFPSIFEGDCPHCGWGLDDWMRWCVWCGEDGSGQTLIQPALRRVKQLLRASRIPRWGYHVLLRPGISGVDPEYPKAVEIERRKVTALTSRAEIPWPSITGLVCHELGHSFMYHHWRWARSPAFVKLFGDVDKAYRGVDRSWVEFGKRQIAHSPVDFVSHYASMHPHEDFAETFRFYVQRRGKMRELLAELGRKRKGVAVYEKFALLHHFIREQLKRR